MNVIVALLLCMARVKSASTLDTINEGCSCTCESFMESGRCVGQLPSAIGHTLQCFSEHCTIRESSLGVGIGVTRVSNVLSDTEVSEVFVKDWKSLE